MSFPLIFLLLFLMAFATFALLARQTVTQRVFSRRVSALMTVAERGVVLPAGLEKEQPANSSGPFPWLDQLLQEHSFGSHLQKLILQSEANISPGTVMGLTAILFVTTLLLAWHFLSLLSVAIVLALLGGSLPMAWLYWKRRKRVASFNVVLPDCIEMCARALRAGHSLTSALGVVASEAMEPAKFEFGEVFRKQNYGLSMREALMQMLERVPSPDLRVFITGILVQKDTGGNLADIMDRIVGVIRDRVRIQGEIRTHTAQGRLTGWILSLLPVMLLLLINLVSPGYSKPMFQAGLGIKLIYAGLVMLALGIFTIRQIVNGIEV